MTMFKKVFGSQMAASIAEGEQPEAMPFVEVAADPPQPRSQPVFAPHPQVLSTKEEENAARRAEKAAEQQERLRKEAASFPSVSAPLERTPPAPQPSFPPAIAPETSAPAVPPRPAGRARTRLIGFGNQVEDVVDPMAGASALPMTQEFPTGWMVIISGPGRGRYFPLFTGVSTIGRDASQAIALNFGDMTVSRESHASIAYDDENNQFYVGHGGKSNIIRLNGRPVLSTEPLSNGDTLRIGETALRFAAFCGDDFQWTAEQHD